MVTLIKKMKSNVQLQNIALLILFTFLIFSAFLLLINTLNLGQYIGCCIIVMLGAIFIKLCDINNNIKSKNS